MAWYSHLMKSGRVKLLLCGQTIVIINTGYNCMFFIIFLLEKNIFQANFVGGTEH
jgi:hypothetical protein